MKKEEINLKLEKCDQIYRIVNKQIKDLFAKKQAIYNDYNRRTNEIREQIREMEERLDKEQQEIMGFEV